MKIFFLILFSLPALASRFADDIQSFGQKGDEITVTFSGHEKVHRMPASSESVPCLENAWKARKPVDVVVDDKNGKILDCKLAPKPLPEESEGNQFLSRSMMRVGSVPPGLMISV